MPDEQAILTMLGIDQDMEESLRPYLGDFFDALPDCQSDTSLYLHKQCEIPYFVLWTTKFAGHTNSEQRKQENQKTHLAETDVEMAIDESFVHDIQPELSEIDQIFTLIHKVHTQQPKVVDIETNTNTESLFHLMVKA